MSRNKKKKIWKGLIMLMEKDRYNVKTGKALSGLEIKSLDPAELSASQISSGKKQLAKAVCRRKIWWTYHVNMRLKGRFISREAILSSVFSYSNSC